ncbi:hypothetical protein [Streptomyces tibetensis]|uniref:Transposase n=1 Tax=Streptomyces tibetensis TaxID=2382123 RepID=A0ABW6MPK9_9ACTN
MSDAEWAVVRDALPVPGWLEGRGGQPESYCHRQISLQGHVVSIKPDEGLADIDRLSRHFLGRDYPARDSPLVTVHVAIDRWFGWSGGRPLQY